MGNVIEKEMGITQAEFRRVLTRAYADEGIQMDGGRVVVADGARKMEISFEPLAERNIALLSLPVARVTLTFEGYDEAEITAAVGRFDRHFQRAGG